MGPSSFELKSDLDQKYSPETPIGLIWACSGDCDVPRYYDWDPTTTVEGGLPEESVLGVEAALWSETIRGAAQALWMALPRAAAVLETGWSRADRHTRQVRAAVSRSSR